MIRAELRAMVYTALFWRTRLAAARRAAAEEALTPGRRSRDGRPDGGLPLTDGATLSGVRMVLAEGTSSWLAGRCAGDAGLPAPSVSCNCLRIGSSANRRKTSFAHALPPTARCAVWWSSSVRRPGGRAILRASAHSGTGCGFRRAES